MQTSLCIVCTILAVKKGVKYKLFQLCFYNRMCSIIWLAEYNSKYMKKSAKDTIKMANKTHYKEQSKKEPRISTCI